MLYLNILFNSIELVKNSLQFKLRFTCNKECIKKGVPYKSAESVYKRLIQFNDPFYIYVPLVYIYSWEKIRMKIAEHQLSDTLIYIIYFWFQIACYGKKKFPSNLIEWCVEKIRGMMKNLKEIRVNLFNFNKALMNMDISGSKDNDIFSPLRASPFHQKWRVVRYKGCKRDLGLTK